jgi:hypothetical protein
LGVARPDDDDDDAESEAEDERFGGIGGTAEVGRRSSSSEEEDDDDPSDLVMACGLCTNSSGAGITLFSVSTEDDDDDEESLRRIECCTTRGALVLPPSESEDVSMRASNFGLINAAFGLSSSEEDDDLRVMGLVSRSCSTEDADETEFLACRSWMMTGTSRVVDEADDDDESFLVSMARGGSASLELLLAATRTACLMTGSDSASDSEDVAIFVSCFCSRDRRLG